MSYEKSRARDRRRESPLPAADFFSSLGLFGLGAACLLPWWVSENGVIQAVGPFVVVPRSGYSHLDTSSLESMLNVVGLPLVLAVGATLAAVALGAGIRAIPGIVNHPLVLAVRAVVGLIAAALELIAWPIGAFFVHLQSGLPFFFSGATGPVRWSWGFGQFAAVVALALLAISAAASVIDLAVHLAATAHPSGRIA